MIPLYDENPTRLRPYVTLALIAINVVAYLWEVRGPEGEMGVRIFQHGTIPYNVSQDGETVLRPRVERVFDGFEIRQRIEARTLRVPADVPEVRAGDWTQPFPPWVTLLTAMFLHGGFWHLLGNLWFLWIFGNNCEDSMGPVRFTVFYLLAGLVASAIHVASDPMSPVPTIGASGAISGILGAYIVLYPKARVFSLVTLGYFFTFIRIPAVLFLGLWFVLQIANVFGDGGEGIAWYAHIGGFVAGMILVKLFESGEHRRRGDLGRRRAPRLAWRGRRG